MIERGLVRQRRPVELCPVADGGEGTLDALLDALGGERLRTTVHDPLERPAEAEFGLVSGNKRGTIGIVETAAASGLHLVAHEERDPMRASTRGTGELIAAAIDAGADTVYVGVGGSATTDGGAGAIRAIERAGGLRGSRLVVLCDVRTAFEDAARVFGPQKGANPADVQRLTRRLHQLARGWERDPRGITMTGAAGGLAGGLWSRMDAELVPGAAFVLDAVNFDSRMRAARAVVTGEGKLDEQSLAGKLVSEIATRTRQAGVPCHAIVGTRELDSFGLRVLDLQAVLEAGSFEEIEAAAGELAGMI
jgi:glycerate kinase